MTLNSKRTLPNPSDFHSLPSKTPDTSLPSLTKTLTTTELLFLVCNFWHKANLGEVPQRLDAAGKLTPLRRQLLGLEQLYSDRRVSPGRSPEGEWMSNTDLKPL